jgi:hypothetical protein
LHGSAIDEFAYALGKLAAGWHPGAIQQDWNEGDTLFEPSLHFGPDGIIPVVNSGAPILSLSKPLWADQDKQDFRLGPDLLNMLS